MVALKIIQAGDALGVVLPREILIEFSVGEGDALYLTKAADGSFVLSPYDDEVAREIAIGEQIMEEYSEVFKQLAK